MRIATTVVLIALAGASSLLAQETDSRAAKLAEQIAAATRGIAAAPDMPDTYQIRARLYALAGRHGESILDYDQLIRLKPDSADAFDERGAQRFMLAQIDRSIEDFDRAIQLDPRREPGHWRRGISYYYAGRYDEGRKQFEHYQMVDNNDVENAVWRFLCVARASGVEAARQSMLKVARDARVPMMEIHQMFSGRLSPDEVIAVAQAASDKTGASATPLFYAHLYAGLYYDSLGDTARARRHLVEAQKRKIEHYMWNVADVHLQLLDRAAKAEPR